jgi:hypothetical protein
VRHRSLASGQLYRLVSLSRSCGSMITARAGSPVVASEISTTMSARYCTGTTALMSVGARETATWPGRLMPAVPLRRSTAISGCWRTRSSGPSCGIEGMSSRYVQCDAV